MPYFGTTSARTVGKARRCRIFAPNLLGAETLLHCRPVPFRYRGRTMLSSSREDERTQSTRRKFLKTSVAAVAATSVLPQLLQAQTSAGGSVSSFEFNEITVNDVRQGLESGRFSSRRLVEQYLARVQSVDKAGPRVNSVIEINPAALAIADELDRERRAKSPHSPLHGIPVLIKDNIATADRMQTTDGSLALVGAKPPRDAFLVARLRAAGAVVLGKTNLSEWANIRSTRSSSGWSGRGGQTRNPYALDR